MIAWPLPAEILVKDRAATVQPDLGQELAERMARQERCSKSRRERRLGEGLTIPSGDHQQVGEMGCCVSLRPGVHGEGRQGAGIPAALLEHDRVAEAIDLPTLDKDVGSLGQRIVEGPVAKIGRNPKTCSCSTTRRLVSR